MWRGSQCVKRVLVREHSLTALVGTDLGDLLMDLDDLLRDSAVGPWESKCDGEIFLRAQQRRVVISGHNRSHDDHVSSIVLGDSGYGEFGDPGNGGVIFYHGHSVSVDHGKVVLHWEDDDCLVPVSVLPREHGDGIGKIGDVGLPRHRNAHGKGNKSNSSDDTIHQSLHETLLLLKAQLLYYLYHIYEKRATIIKNPLKLRIFRIWGI